MLTGRKIRIEVPQPAPVQYSLNWRGHWVERYRAGAEYQMAVFCCCVDARNRALAQGMSLPFVMAKLDLTFIFPQPRRRDRDNLLSRFKPGQDALVKAGLLLDDDSEHLEIAGVDIIVDPQRAPLTVIDIEEVLWR